MKEWRVPFTNLVVQHCYVLPILLTVLFFLTAWIITDRHDVVTYGRFYLKSGTVKAFTEAALMMDVSWRQPGCKVKTQLMAWSLDGKNSFPIEGPHTSEKPKQLILIDKPRLVQIPQIPAGEYEIGFEYVYGQCWWWEKYLPIQNSLPPRSKFTVTP